MLKRLEYKFVKSVPRVLEPGILYVSLDYGTAVHSCCCGCREEVVTPITPTDWNLTFDGVSISLSPSVGNWNLKCRSHYFIRKGEVIVASSWSKEQIDAEWERDKLIKGEYYNTTHSIAKNKRLSGSDLYIQPESETSKAGFLNYLKSIFK